MLATSLGWAVLRDDPFPEALFGLWETPWVEAARLIRDGDPGAAADVLHAIGALTPEARVRLHAATSLAASDPGGGPPSARARDDVLPLGRRHRAARPARRARRDAATRGVVAQTAAARSRASQSSSPPTATGRASYPRELSTLAAIAARGPVSQTVTSVRSRGSSAVPARR